MSAQSETQLAEGRVWRGNRCICEAPKWSLPSWTARGLESPLSLAIAVVRLLAAQLSRPEEFYSEMKRPLEATDSKEEVMGEL